MTDKPGVQIPLHFGTGNDHSVSISKYLTPFLAHLIAPFIYPVFMPALGFKLLRG